MTERNEGRGQENEEEREDVYATSSTQVKHEKGTLWKRERTKKVHPNNNNKNTTKEKK